MYRQIALLLLPLLVASTMAPAAGLATSVEATSQATPMPVGTAPRGAGAPVRSPSTADAVFDPHHVLDVELTLDPDDWERLRFETRDVGDLFAGDCLARPFANPFRYYPASARIDGDPLPRVGVRKKGFVGSLSTDKPSLKLKFTKYDGTEYRGLTRLTLNNSLQDPTWMRQCISYEMFAKAGVAAPRCNYAHVLVNGFDLGLYVNVETVDARFIATRFPEPRGPLYEGTLSDFSLPWLGTFERKDVGPASAGDELRRVARAASSSSMNPADSSELRRLINVDQFVRFWSAEVAIAHWDGYTNNKNNFFVYNEAAPPRSRLVWIPWGTDTTLGPDPFALPGTPSSVYQEGAIARRLYADPEARAAYWARLRWLLTTVWDEDHLQAEIDEDTALVRPIVELGADVRAFDAAVADLRAFIAHRPSAILSELAIAPPPPLSRPHEPPCTGAPATDRDDD